MKIVADANIPYLKEAMKDIGEVQAFPGKELTAGTVKDAELLFVRSTIKVNQALLENSRVRFIATATIGTDHIDFDFLQKNNIAFSAAPGSNSNSVAEWFVNSLLTLAERRNISLYGKVIGVVGVGNVGSKIVRNAAALGMKVLLCDPPLARKTNDAKYRPLDELLEACDILTFHVPLEKKGEDKTVHLLHADNLKKIKPNTILINASRGPVIDGKALLEAIERKHFLGVILDVWETEPSPEPALIHAVDLGSPHVAGHSLDGKALGTQMVYQAACRFLQIEPTWRASQSLPETSVSHLSLSGASDEALILQAMRSLHRVEEDDTFMRKLAALSTDEMSKQFSSYRNQYRPRREATYTKVSVPEGNGWLKEALRVIGFQIS
jgi:erythronate-4-phosphate dehydrogenase